MVRERGLALRVYLTLIPVLIWAAACVSVPRGAVAQETGRERIAPDWFTVDAENRKVGLYIVAALTTVNSGWNFNGYANGDMTIAVPLDWRVEIRFTSRDGNYPHSMGIVEITNEMPVSGDGAKVAFSGAFSLQFTRGFFGPKEDKFGFKANKSGQFWLFCGVPGHAKGGMWDYFVVSDTISEPYVEVEAAESP